MAPLKKVLKRNLTFSSLFGKKKKKQGEKPLSGLRFHIKNTGYQENKRVFVFQGVIGFAVHNRPYGGRLDSSLSVKRPPVHER